MSTFITRNGSRVECVDPACICNARIATTTRGAIDAAAEEAWFAELDDAMQEYLNLYAQFVAAPKSERDQLEVKVHQAKRDVVSRFYAKGWSE